MLAVAVEPEGQQVSAKVARGTDLPHWPQLRARPPRSRDRRLFGSLSLLGVFSLMEWPVTHPALACDSYAGIWHVTAEHYYADSCRVSKSMLDVFSDSIPEYHARFVIRTLEQGQPSKDMLLGTALHTLLMTPDEPIPKECESKRPLVEAWAEAVRRHEFARQLLAEAELIETVLAWTDRKSGLPCKARVDGVATGLGIVFDVKTAADPTPEGFSRAIANYGYHRQLAHYSEGVKRALGIDAQAALIVVGKSPPHEVAVYELDDVWMRLAREQLDDLLGGLAKCYRTDTWNSRLAGVRCLSAPRWSLYQHENRLTY